MIKVLIIITTSFVPFGGLTTVMMNYYRAMDKTDLQIDFASTNGPPNSLLDELKANGSKYFNLGNRKEQLSKYLKNLKAVLKSGYYDVVHVNGNSATMAFELMIAKRYGVSMRIAHGHTTRTNHAILHRFLKGVFKKSYTHAVAVSSKAGNWLYDGDKYEIVKNAINVEKYKYNEIVRKQIRSNLKIEDRCVIGHLGKIYEPKNHNFLIDIFHEIKKTNENACLLLVGDGELKDKIRVKCERLNLEDVIFIGMVSNVYDYLQAMDVFVFPSLWEGSPLALIEAQASGGRLETIKGVEILIEAVQRLCAERNVQLTIVGGGSCEKSLKDKVKYYGLGQNVCFEGVQRDREKYLRNTDIFIYPSICEEVFGISIVEALSYGVPSVAFSVGGIPEIINEGYNGALSEEKTVEGLKDAIVRIISVYESGQIEEMSRNCIESANRFSISNTVNQLKDIFEHL